ncbi:hypothetical protein NDU88_002702 [Pleurodeles waltl]|uniref:Uncharacterized protein n=1 Tax=Pleurodeles waltl TaxID=8319 RepID=A0AAV7KUZ2_PLEWA|nr:hypothetical protein NDU88_002702 [Pleurodeles waltl]
MVIHFRHYHDRDMVIKEAYSLAEVRVDSTKVKFVPDYTLALQRQRNSFLAVKRRLWRHGTGWRTRMAGRSPDVVLTAGRQRCVAKSRRAEEDEEAPGYGASCGPIFGAEN